MALHLARVPTHDPLVGRVVGHMMASQVLWDRPEEVHLSGQCDDGMIDITFARRDDGTVAAEGYCGSVEIHEVYSGVATEPFGVSDKSRLFGVAGNQLSNVVAQVSGTVGGQAVEAVMTSERSERLVELTEETKSKSPGSGFAMGSKVHQSPAFGGASVTTYVKPNATPTQTQPVETTDDVAVRGKIGDLEFGQFLEWKTTTWATVWNTTDGWGWEEFHKVDQGSLREHYKSGDQEAKTGRPIALEVTSGPSAEGRGNLVGELESTSVEKSYQTLREKGGVVHVEQRYGDWSASFDIYTVDGRGARAGVDTDEPRKEHR